MTVERANGGKVDRSWEQYFQRRKYSEVQGFGCGSDRRVSEIAMAEERDEVGDLLLSSVDVALSWRRRICSTNKIDPTEKK